MGYLGLNGDPFPNVSPYFIMHLLSAKDSPMPYQRFVPVAGRRKGDYKMLFILAVITTTPEHTHSQNPLPVIPAYYSHVTVSGSFSRKGSTLCPLYHQLLSSIATLTSLQCLISFDLLQCEKLVYYHCCCIMYALLSIMLLLTPLLLFMQWDASMCCFACVMDKER